MLLLCPHLYKTDGIYPVPTEDWSRLSGVGTAYMLSVVPSHNQGSNE